MSRTLRLLALAGVVGVIAAAGADTPSDRPLASAEHAAVVTGQGYFPVALRLQDGRIAVILRGGAPHLGIQGRLDMVFSADEGKTWTAPSVVARSEVDNRNPALGQAADGTLVAGFWRTARYHDNGRYDPKLDKPVNTWVTRSADGGKTWSEPAEVDVTDIGWGSPYGRIVTLPDGAMLMAVYGGPVQSESPKADPNENHSYIYRSTDNGRSWKRFAEVGAGAGQFNETSLLLPGGKEMLAALRSRAGEVWTSRSADAGKSWAPPQRITPRNVHPGDLCLLPGGRVLLTVGQRAGPFGVCGLVSDASGSFHWSRRFTLLEDAVSRDCGYPSSVLLRDGRVLTVYYATGRKEHPEWKVHCGGVVYVPPAVQ